MGDFFGGLEGIRTLDLSDANRTLSQLSYEPKMFILNNFAIFSLCCLMKRLDESILA